MNDDIDEIKRRINLVDLVGSYLPLKKSGGGWKGSCPFHQEKTASFNVNPERQIFKCFGCNEAGDAIDFVMKMEHLTFPEGLQLLADRVGVILDRRKTPDQYAKEKDEKSRLYQINRLSLEVFHKILLEHPQAASVREYLVSRGLSDATVRTFKIGFAPAYPRGSSSVLERFLAGRGFTAAERKLAGSPERFSNRLIFPLWDTLGNVVGFTGRALDPDDQPKYLNTPETPIFKKSRVLYPLHHARDGIKTAHQAILVEGQMDVLLAHQIGTSEVVATSGTALTADHLAILRRYTPRILFAFDNDKAGLEATRKAIILAYELELEPFVVSLPADYKDLGELALAKPALWAEAVAVAQPGFAWQLAAAVAEHTVQSSTGKKAVAKVTLPILARVRDPIERAHWLQVLAETLRMPERTIVEALDRTKSTPLAQPTGGPVSTATTAERRTADEVLLGLLLAYPEHIPQVITHIEEWFFSGNNRTERVAKILLTWYSNPETIEYSHALAAVERQLNRDDSTWLAGLVSEIETRHAADPSPAIRAEIDSSVAKLRLARREELKETMAAKIAAAEARGDRPAVQELLKEFQHMLKSKL